MILIEAKNISKNFTTAFGLTSELFEDVSFELKEKEILTFLAPRQAGKSTLLKISAKMFEPDSGTLTVYSPPVFIPGEPNSFPWLNVEENLRFVNSFLQEKEINELLELVGLEGYGKHFPNNKSAGFRFRISLARALALKPKAIILDEVFAAVRHDVKKELYDLILKIKDEKGIAFLLGTSNITEAVYLSDKIIQLSKHPGKVINEIDAAKIKKESASEAEEKIKKEITSKFKEYFKENVFDFAI